MARHAPPLKNALGPSCFNVFLIGENVELF